MAETYCGKSCNECTERENTDCPGCKLGSGKSLGGTCKLAKCVQSKGHETCDTCSFQLKCNTYANRYQVPEDRRREAEEEETRRGELSCRAPILGKWIGILFWLCVPSAIGEFLASDLMRDALPGVYGIGVLIQFASRIAYGVILIKLSSMDNRYMTAGICALVSHVVNSLVNAYSTDTALTLLLSVPLLIAAIYGEYRECMSHAEAVSDFDAELMLKWENLWKWSVGMNIGLICSAFLMMIPLIGVLALLGCLVGTIVVGILKLVYLYRTAKVFREYADF